MSHPFATRTSMRTSRPEASAHPPFATATSQRLDIAALVLLFSSAFPEVRKYFFLRALQDVVVLDFASRYFASPFLPPDRSPPFFAAAVKSLLSDPPAWLLGRFAYAEQLAALVQPIKPLVPMLLDR